VKRARIRKVRVRRRVLVRMVVVVVGGWRMEEEGWIWVDKGGGCW